MEEEKNILYRPELGVKRHYETKGVFSQSHVDIDRIPDEIPDVDHSPGKIKEDLKVIQNTFEHVLPKDVRFIGKSIIKKLIQRLDVISPDGKKHYEIPEPKEYAPKEVETIKTDFLSPDIEKRYSESKDSEVDFPALFPASSNVNIKLETPKSLVQIIQADYEADQLRLDEYYTAKLKLIFQDYIQQMLAIMTETGVSDMDILTQDFDGEAVVIPYGKNLEHCRDYIVRSQIMREQKTRLLQKTHKVDCTTAHMRSWQAAEKQRERYYREKYGDSGTYTESHSNSLLREQRKMYDANYKSAAYSMFKYLDSSVQIVGESLNMVIKEAQAKAQLMKNDVNIFATKDVDTSPTLSGEKKKANKKVDEDQEKAAKEPGDKADKNHSHGKAPNGKYYSNNDWDYLKAQKLSEEQIKAILDLDSKYHGGNKDGSK